MSLLFWGPRGSGAIRALRLAGGLRLLACVTPLGCALAEESQLLTLTGIDSAEVVLGDELRVQGHGFPTGSSCTARLRGQLWQAGSVVRSIDVPLAAQAISTDEIAIRVEPSALPAIDAHATFSGRVSLSFAGAAGASRVAGELDRVVFDLLRADVELSQRYAHLRRAYETLRVLGVVLEDAEESSAGLRIRWARDGSVASAAGLRQGDLLTHMDGLRVRTAADLVPAPGATQIQLRVRPSARASERVVTLPIASVERPELGHAGRIISAIAALMLACLFWFAPVPRRLVRFRSAPENEQTPQERRVMDPPLSLVSTPIPAPSRRLVAVVLWPIVASVYWIALAVGPRWHVTWHLLAVAALIGAAHVVMRVRPNLFADRARWLLRELALLLVAFLPLACAGLIAGSMTLTGIVEQQGASPWQWFVFRAPPMLLACAAFLGGARRLIDRSANLQDPTSTAFAIVFAGVGAAAFLGGWQPFELGVIRSADPAVAGVVAFAIKAWVVFLTLSLPRRDDVSWLATTTWLALSAASVALSLLWIRLPLVPAVELVVGYSLCGATFTVGMLQLWRAQRASTMPLH